jgi:aryl-alcohol dehydrogenase-like predicted oxidoreductase
MKLSLDHYRLLGSSGLRVSPMCLGTMTFGTQWGWGASQDDCQAMVRTYLERGGNFIDTANKYTEGESERIVGKLIEGKRERIVLSTKYSLSTTAGDPNACGNQRRNMVYAIENSLQRLKTDCIDLYWMHAWDALTPIQEVMRGLDDLVRAGKIVHIGVSDTPAWKVAQGNTLAELRGWSSFVALQCEYNLVERTPERELVPMARDLRLGVMPWSPLAGGLLTGKHAGPGAGAEDSKRAALVRDRLTPRVERILSALREVAGECGCSMARAALSWVSTQPGVASVLLGARTAAQLEDNLASLEVELASAQRDRLDRASAIELGFPHEFLASASVKDIVFGGTTVSAAP